MRNKIYSLLATSLILFSVGSKAEGSLYLYNWSNYIPTELLEKFESETGIDVTLDVYDSNETMLAKLQAGASGYDIIVPSDFMMTTLIEEDLVEKINAKEFENFALVMAPHDAPVQDANREYSAPYMWGTTSFAYDSAKVSSELEASWKSFFEPIDELKGHVAVLNDITEVWNAAAYYVGAEKCTENVEDAKKIQDVLLAQKPYVAVYQSDGSIDRLSSGEVLMHHQFNGASHRTKNKLSSVVYVYPKEGLTAWGDNFMVVKNAPNLDNAKTFINWMLKPENAAEASNFTGYMNAIKGSSEFLNDALKADPAVNMPEEYANLLRPSESCSTKNRELRDRVWTKLKK